MKYFSVSASNIFQTHLPDTDTGVGDQNEQDHKRFNKGCYRIIIFKECKNLRDVYNIKTVLFKKSFLYSYKGNDGCQQQNFHQQIIKLF